MLKKNLAILWPTITLTKSKKKSLEYSASEMTVELTPRFSLRELLRISLCPVRWPSRRNKNSYSPKEKTKARLNKLEST